MNVTSAPAVQILLATYNGERFLREQIDSLLSQTYQPLTILASDDGSTDSTLAILKEYAARLPVRFHILPATTPAGGAKRNFSRLLENATESYMAFADQDDVWLPSKIADSMKAMHALERKHGQATPLLIFTDLRIVNEKLETLQPSLWAHQSIDPQRIHRYSRLLVQNTVTGCTTLINRPLASLATPIPAEASMHDAWIGLLASSFGSAGYLAEQTVLYRQHASNAVGAAAGKPRRLIPDWRNHAARRDQWERGVRQAKGLLRLHGKALDQRKRNLLEAYLHCDTHPNRVARVFTLLRYGFLIKGLRNNLAILWYLWDMRAAKRAWHAPRR